mmetsp:Transcript_43909/g.80235  ORF Transcript_43909/g.80235 Transcript_43909/m.80235 type:complete len:445 (+) Transcript_43909:66-1400(+)
MEIGDAEQKSQAHRPDLEWLWEALVHCRHSHGVIRNLAPPGFDWNEAHQRYGTPLMATVNEIVRSGVVHDDVRRVLIWCMKQGADPRRAAPILPHGIIGGHSGGWGNGTDEFPYVGQVEHQGNSAVTLLLGLLKVLEWINNYEHKGKYIGQVNAAKDLLNIFAQFRPSVKVERICAGTVDLWSAIKDDEESADVELHMDGEVLRAHACVLCNASPVLRAALTSHMLEGTSRIVNVDADKPVVEFVIHALYTGKLSPSHIVKMGNPTTGEQFTVGEQVEANWRNRGTFWKATIAGCNDDGTYNITYSEGGYRERWVPAHRLKTQVLCTQKPEQVVHDKLNVEMLLAATSLAHFWQCQRVVTLFEDALVLDMTEGQFASMWGSGRKLPDQLVQCYAQCFEKSMQLDLISLKSSCVTIAEDSPAVYTAYKENSFNDILTHELEKIFT